MCHVKGIFSGSLRDAEESHYKGLVFETVIQDEPAFNRQQKQGCQHQLQ